jgi:ribose 5-phosphate isomerase B
MMRVAIAADHAGFELKGQLGEALRASGYEVVDFGASTFDAEDDYPDFVIPMAKAVAEQKAERGIAICGSSIGACIAANKVRGVRAGPCSDHYSAHQGVEDDNMNVICLGGRLTGYALAWEMIQAFLSARFSGAERHRRRLAKVAKLENKEGVTS